MFPSARWAQMDSPVKPANDDREADCLALSGQS